MTISPAVSGGEDIKTAGSLKHEHSSHKHDSHKHNKKHSGHKRKRAGRPKPQERTRRPQARCQPTKRRRVWIKVEIELASPGVDIVGRTQTEHRGTKASKALAKLREPGTLVDFPKEANCKRTATEAPRTGIEEHAEFVCICTSHNPSAIDHMNITVFSAFPSIREINAQAITQWPIRCGIDFEARPLTLK